jgi:CheY-like chemotaxis protein
MANILILDSYSAVSLLYREVLEEHGYYVFTAASGREALLLALHRPIDIAVVDDRLPDFSPDEVFARLKQIQPDVRGILNVSSIFGSASNGERWDGLIGKSSDYTLLGAEVDRLVGLGNARESGRPARRISELLLSD